MMAEISIANDCRLELLWACIHADGGLLISEVETMRRSPVTRVAA